jgi:hypothetical protein
MSNDDYGYAVKQTYLYLRLSLVGTIVAIFLAVAFTPADLRPEGQGVLASISHYFYSPARIVFAGALCAAALALLALAGKGIQSYLLDIAALLAPLIAVVPTPVKLNEVATFDPKCATPDDQCIPPADFATVRLGFTVWLVLIAAVILFGFVRALMQREKAQPLFWWTLWGALAIWLAFAVTGIWVQTWFNASAHFTAAGAFFIIVSLVAWIEAVRQLRTEPETRVAKRDRTLFTVAYGAIGLLLLIDIATAAVVIVVQREFAPAFWPVGVFVVEVVGLSLFALFFAVQTIDHRGDGDGWGMLPPSRKQRRAAAN